jgi:endonuclease-8
VANLLAEPDRSALSALLDQRVVAGIGNLYAAEVLFLSRAAPDAPVRALPDPAHTLDTAHRLLRSNRDHDAQSTPGRMERGAQHWVYQRAGEPCRRCGAVIRTARFGEPPRDRITFWCPRCQPALPTR